MNRVYLRGSSLISALGNNKNDAVKKVQSIDNSNYQDYLDDNFEDIHYYRIKQNFKNNKEKLFQVISKSVYDAIEDAKLSKNEQEELHIYIGSTSMSISISEELDDLLENIGFGDIALYIEGLLDSKYPSTTIQTACTSTANCFTKASELIKHNKIQRALIVGFEFFNFSTYKGFESLMLLSSKGEYKPFDKNSDGLVLAEACSTIILDSKRNTKNAFEYLSSSSMFDNYSVTGANPNGEIAYLCLDEAIKKAELDYKSITCIKAHNAGSESSNISEVNSLNKLFNAYNKTLPISILKPYIGHTLGASSAVEITLLCECIKNSFIPKTLNFKEPYEQMTFTPLEEDIHVDKATIAFLSIGFGGGTSTIILSNEN
jgi:3-oxoacyl-[acyl-carrier-protein] synthase-1